MAEARWCVSEGWGWNIAGSAVSGFGWYIAGLLLWRGSMSGFGWYIAGLLLWQRHGGV